MRKIDTTRIEGYETMTAEEKLAALESYEFEEPVQDTSEVEKYKSLLTKANTEAADYKRKLKEKMSEQERAEAERAEAEKATREELNTLRAEKRVSVYTNRLVGAGYDLETAKVMATSLPEGLEDSYFESQKTFLENKQKQIEADLLKKQPTLTGGKPLAGEDIQKEQDAKLRSYWGL